MIIHQLPHSARISTQYVQGSEKYTANRMASPSYLRTSASRMWNKNQPVTHTFQYNILLLYFRFLFLSIAFCQDLAAGIKGGTTCLNHADERICFVPWGFCISVLWPQSHLSINYMIHFKEQVWPCCLLSSGTAMDTTSTKAWQSSKIYFPWSFKIGFWIANTCMSTFWRHSKIHDCLYSCNMGDIHVNDYFL